MSYDLELKIEDTTIELVKSKINTIDHIENLCYCPNENYYMKIDIEANQKILFHIPHSYMDLDNIVHDLYFDKINEIAQKFDSTAFDLQQEQFINDPDYNSPKIRILKSPVFGNPYTSMIFEDNKINLFSKDVESCFQIDLKQLAISIQKNLKYEVPQRPKFSMLKRFDDQYSNYFAIRHWNKKIFRVYSNSNDWKNVDNATIWESPIYQEFTKCGKVTNLSFNQDGSILSAAYKSKTLRLWNTESNKIDRKFTNYTSANFSFAKVNDRLLFVFSKNGITFFDYQKGTLLIHVYPFDGSWFCFDKNANYDGQLNKDAVYELAYKDNKYSESHCFVPDIGFAVYRPSQKWKLLNVKTKKNGKSQIDLLKQTLAPYL